MTSAEIIALVVAVLAAALAAGAVMFLFSSNRRRADSLARASDAASAADVAALRQAVDARLDNFTRLLANTSDAINRQLAAAGDTITSVQQGIGELRSSSDKVVELGQNINKLQEILRPPKARGGVGEVLLDNVLAQVLSPSQYRRQFPLAGSFVDFAVKVGNKYVPIDAKFPLESFERMLAAEDEAGRAKCRRELRGVVKGKIDDIAAKYIRPDLGTYDFALMYLPSENLYYQAAVADAELFDYAARRRVFPVSPATVYVYLATIALGLRGMALEGRAAVIAAELSRLGDELGKFQELFRVTGKHLRDAANKYDEAGRALATFGDRLDAARLIEADDSGRERAVPPADTQLFDA